MTTITAPLTSFALAALVPDIVRSCVVLQPSPPPDPGEEPPAPVTGNDIYTPIAPGVTYANLPVAPTIVDTSPDQMIGCIITVADNPQGRLNALFPSAISGDGVIDRATNDIWVYDGATWNNVGPTPGPTITATVVIPPWNETLLAVARTRTKLSVNALAYALELLTEPDPIVTTTALTARSVPAYIAVPVAQLTLAPHVPVVASGGSASVPLATASLAAAAPAVAAGKSVSVPLLDTAFAASMVPYVGPQATVIQPPAADTALSGATPTISAGKALAVPSLDIAVAAHIPQVNDEPPTVAVVGTQSASTSSILLSLGTYLQDDILLLIIETGGEDGTLIPPSPWDTVTGSPVTDVATSAGSKLQVWWQRAAANSTGTENVLIGDSGNHQLARLYTIRGCTTTGNPWDTIGTSQKTTASFTSTAPSVTTSYGQTLVLSVVTRPNDSSSVTFFSAPTNATLTSLTDEGEAGTTSGHGGGFAVSSGIKVLPGSTGVTTFTHGTSVTSTGMTIAFRP